jgi:heme/copper-type cytochrome/quinol oxidase subunit 2
MVRASDGDAREEAKGYVIWAVIALFVMVSVWGLVNILVRSFRLDNSAPPLPTVRDVQ